MILHIVEVFKLSNEAKICREFVYQIQTLEFRGAGEVGEENFF